MRIATNIYATFSDDPARHLGLEGYESQCGDFVACVGYSDFSKLSVGSNERIIQIELEEPNRFWFERDSSLQFQPRFEKIFTLCPYTAEWLNRKEKTNRRVPVFFPFSGNMIPEMTSKCYDVVYAGGAHSPQIKKMLAVLPNFNYRFISQSHHCLVTDARVSYGHKLRLIAKSKITLVHNLLFVDYGQQKRLWGVADYKGNEAFKLIRDPFPSAAVWKRGYTIVPQLKSRLFEAAFCRSLILCRRDPWNVVERFFEPGREFLYFEEGGLEQSIRAIVKNYRSFASIVDRAYDRAVSEYTTECFVKKFLAVLP